jgi:outer membrane protein N
VGDYGSFDYGRNYGVLYDVEGWTDMLPEFGGDSYTKADNFMTGRANGVATYRNTDFYGLVQGLNFALQYQGKNEDASNNQEGTNNGATRVMRTVTASVFPPPMTWHGHQRRCSVHLF